MTAREVMVRLYPDLTEAQLAVNIAWLELASRVVRNGGIIGSPRDGWAIRVVKPGQYDIEFT